MADRLVLPGLPGHHLLLHRDDNRPHIWRSRLESITGNSCSTSPKRNIHISLDRRHSAPIQRWLHNKQRNNPKPAASHQQIHPLLLLPRPLPGRLHSDSPSSAIVPHKLGKGDNNVQVHQNVRNGCHPRQESLHKCEGKIIL